MYHIKKVKYQSHSFQYFVISINDPDDNFRVNPLMLAHSRQKEHFFEEEMSIRPLPTTLLQIFSKTNPSFKIIVKGIIDPDNNFRMNSLSINGLKLIT